MAVLRRTVTATGSGDKGKSKKSASEGVKIGDKKKRKQSKQNYSPYIYKVLKQVAEIRLSSTKTDRSFSILETITIFLS